MFAFAFVQDGGGGGWYSKESPWRNGWCDDTETRRNGKPAARTYLAGAGAVAAGYLRLSFLTFLSYQPKVSRDPATAGT